MRSLALLVFLVGCARTAVTVPVDPVPAPRVVAHDKVTLSVPGTRPRTFATHAGDTAWVATLPKTQTFARIDGLAGAASLAITWRQFPQHRRPGLEGEGDYPSLYAGKVELEVRGDDGAVRTLSLGQQSGNVEGGEVTACERAGYRHPPAGDSGAMYTFRHADLANRVAFWEVGTMQGSTEYLLLLGKDRLEILHRGTHDGACPTAITQGPLGDICEDMKWERAFEIPVHGEPRVTEASVHVEENGGTPEPMNCQGSYSGQDLVPPGE